MFEIIDYPRGRLGNAIFRYLASSLFIILFNYKRSNVNNNFRSFSEYNFKKWMNNPVNPKYNLILADFYQHDKIYIKYKKELLDHMFKNLDDKLITDKNEVYTVKDLLIPKSNQKYFDIVCHIRLEDFIEINQVINPLCFDIIFQKIKETEKIAKICLVVNKPKTELETKYIDYLVNKYNCDIHSESVIEDWHVLMNARILVCSNSTLSWCAALLSNKVEKVYFPEIDYNKNSHVTFRKPIENTEYYKIELCSKEKLLNIL